MRSPKALNSQTHDREAISSCTFQEVIHGIRQTCWMTERRNSRRMRFDFQLGFGTYLKVWGSSEQGCMCIRVGAGLELQRPQLSAHVQLPYLEALKVALIGDISTYQDQLHLPSPLIR